MQTTPERRILVIANRTAATPRVLEAVRRLAGEQPSAFALLIPDAPHSKHTDWTLDRALPYLERAAGRPVEGLTGTSGDPFDAIRDVVANGQAVGAARQDGDGTHRGTDFITKAGGGVAEAGTEGWAGPKARPGTG